MAGQCDIRFRWLFIDMNSFFASVEQHLRPELRGRMVGVIPVESEGSCIIAASADAKRLGVKVGTRVRDARRLCPDIALVKARPSVYVGVHQAVGRTIDRCVPVHNVYSIDEWAVRLVEREREPELAIELARRIKHEIRRDFSPWMTCSIGIAQTRLLAKIASDLHKPDGLTTLHTRDLPGRLEGLQLNDFPGIGGAMLRRLHAAGVRTVRQLWDLSPQDARRIWGSVMGESWWHGFHGVDLPEPSTRRRSINQSNVLPPAHRGDAGAHAVLVRLLCNAAWRLRCHACVAHRLHIHVRAYNGREWGTDAPLDGTQDTVVLGRVLGSLWRTRPWAAEGEQEWRPFAKVSITLSGLKPIAEVAPTLFDAPRPTTALSHAIDRINLRWGRNALYLGSVHHCRHEMEDKIAFGRIPDETKHDPDARARHTRPRGADSPR